MAAAAASNVVHPSGEHHTPPETAPQNKGAAGSGGRALLDNIQIPSPLLQIQHPDHNWHGKDPALRRFDYLELQSHGHAFGTYWTAKSSLDNGIHPLFRDLVNIPGLQPALRLASKFLSEPKILSFWHALIFNDYLPLQQETQNIGWPCYQISLNPDPLSPEDVEKTQAAILRISKDVRITSHNHSCFRDMLAFTKRTRHNIKTTGDETAGTSSYVTISPRTFRLLHPGTFMPQDQRNRISLMLAVTLCHEFAHAVYMFRSPLPLCQDGSMQPPGASEEIEPFIGNDRKSELGRAWESVVFGGQVNSFGEREDCQYGLELTKWPGSKTNYKVNQINRAVVPVARVDTSPAKWETHYVIPMEFVEKLFDRNYWEHDVQQNGIQALRFEKKLGYRRRNHDWVDTGLGDGYDTDDSERSRHPDGDGIVRPDQPHLPSPSVSESDEEHVLSSTESEASDFPPGYSDDGGSEFDTGHTSNNNDAIFADVDLGNEIGLRLPGYSLPDDDEYVDDVSSGEWPPRIPGINPHSFNSTASEVSTEFEDPYAGISVSPHDPGPELELDSHIEEEYDFVYE